MKEVPGQIHNLVARITEFMNPSRRAPEVSPMYRDTRDFASLRLRSARAG